MSVKPMFPITQGWYIEFWKDNQIYCAGLWWTLLEVVRWKNRCSIQEYRILFKLPMVDR